MIAITNIVIFFAVLVVSYPVATMVLALLTWFRKRRAMKTEDRLERIERIDASTDRLKDRLFIVFTIMTLGFR